jgi:hypothetical protein
MSDKFDQFVKKQIASSGTSEDKLDLAKEKEMWLAKLEQLYSLVSESLSEYIADRSIVLEYSDVILTEELLGSYPVREAHIAVGRDVVKLKPIGTFLIGSRGRVDMVGPKGATRLTIVPPGARAPRVRVTIVHHGETPPADEPVDPPETWVWKIATPPPRITYIDLTKESFREALMGVVNG